MVRARRTFWRAFLGLFLIVSVTSCAGGKHASESSDIVENGEYLLFLSNFQGNPLCLFGSIQKMRVFPWLTSPRTRWRVHTWLILPGFSKQLFSDKGKEKEALSIPLKYTDDTLLFTTNNDQFVFFHPFPDDKLLMVSDPIFPDRVRKSGEEDIRYSLLRSSLTWNNQKVDGQLFYQKIETSNPGNPSSFLPLTGLEKGGRIFAIWVPGGMFLYLEQPGEISGEGRSANAIMQDRRGKWEETYDVTLIEPAHAFSGLASSGGEGNSLRLDLPLWRITGDLQVIEQVRPGMEAEGQAVSGPGKGAAGERLFWKSLEKIPEPEAKNAVAFCLLKGSLQVSGETKSVYGVGISER
jgi:hypothetical protein